ncbi:MAG TPA: DUF1697 domain-containing protein [Thermoplasmatales archaeon]|nr:DUF1697 domain-containing protein [Thermoplasmatales archaeon]
MKKGVAFLHAVGMFGHNNITQKQLTEVFNQTNKDFNILGFDGNDNIVFEKRDDVHYATVGKIIEKTLEKKLKIRVAVTTRSMHTLKRIVSQYG